MRLILVTILLSIYSSCAFSTTEPTYALCTQKFSEIAGKYKTIDEYIAAWNKCKEYCPNDGAFEDYYASLYGGFDLNKDALKYISAEAKKHKKIPKRILFALADFLYINGMENESIKVTSELVKNFPNWYGGYRLYGNHYTEKGELLIAHDYFALAVNEKEEGRNAWNYMSLVHVDYLLKDYEQAAKAFMLADIDNAGIAYRSKDITCYGAISLIKIKDLESARLVLKTQAKVDPEAVNLKSYKKAVRLYEKAAGTPLN